jgi:integrase
MSRKLGQIIAVRENTWMIRIPRGYDLQTKQRSYSIDLIFVTELGRPVNVNSLVYKHFKLILRAGLPNIRLYDLRHTAATPALTVGVSPKVVSEQLGHTSAAFTLDVYSHVLPHMQDDAAAKVEAALLGP